MKVFLTWTNLKSTISTKKLYMQYSNPAYRYYVFALDADIEYYTELWTDTTQVVGIDVEQNNIDLADFNDNYKAAANASVVLKDSFGKPYIRAETTPPGTTTVFTACGDDVSIGDGKLLAWDFSNDDDLITAPTGFKRKRIEFHFLDTVYMKEGTIYFQNVLKGSYFDQYIVCPTGYYYYNNAGQIRQATEDTPIAHYVIKQPINGNTSAGLQLMTETCSSGIPNYYKFWSDVTVPDTDSTSYGYARAMVYRSRTLILS